MKPILCLSAVFALACGSSPASEFFVLSPQQAADDSKAFAPSNLTIEVRRPKLPSYLQRQTMVRRAADGRLVVSDTQRWGGELSEMVEGVLSSNLNELLPQSTVTSETGGLSGRKDVLVEVQFARFEVGPSGDVRLDARVGLHFLHGRDRWQLEKFATTADARNSTASQVRGMNEALFALSTFIAGAITRGIESTDPESSDRLTDSRFDRSL